MYGDEFYNVEVLNNPIAEDDEDEDEDEGGVNIQALKIWRNNIAQAMWAQYQLNLAQHNA